MGQGSSRTVVTNALNDITSSSFLQVTTKCAQFTELKQNMTIYCKPGLSEYGSINWYEENPVCIKCWTDIIEQQKARYDIIQEAWGGGEPVGIPMTFNDEFEGYYNQMMACLLRCKACVFTDFSQANNFEWNTSCSITTTDVQNMKNTMQANITQALTDNQDVLSSLAKMLGSSDKQSVVTNIMNRIDDRITVGFMETLRDKLQNFQNITISYASGGTAQGLTQTSAVVGLSKMVADLNITNQVFSDEQWSVYQQLYNQQNTVGELGQVLSKSFVGMAELLDSLVGKIMLGVVIAVGAVLLIVAVVAIVKAKKHHRI